MTEWDGKSDLVTEVYYNSEETRQLYEREGRPEWIGHAEVEWTVSGALRYEPNAVSVCHPDFGFHVHDEAFYRELHALVRGVRAIAEQTAKW